MGDISLSSNPLAAYNHRHAPADRTQDSSRVSPFTADSLRKATCLEPDAFHITLALERRRAERSRKPFFLMLLDANQYNDKRAGEKILRRAALGLTPSIRETDLLGWYAPGTILGAIFTEVGDDAPELIANVLRAKSEILLRKTLGREQTEKIRMSLHVFPESWGPEQTRWTADPKLYPDVHSQAPRKKTSLAIKRAMDVAGSTALLLILSPLLAVIALAIKFSSKGPVLFAQERLGQFGMRFKCLKFRTMHSNCDPKLHQDYVQKFIAGKDAGSQQASDTSGIYKITDDPRVTRIGRFLRRTSLDELPQFWNVLRGEMSLVGPRPPVPYEFELYDIWHRRRVLEIKPGVTGLWQVSGRSRTQFDDMVRLDLRYCNSWSLWLDLKILLATPGAVFSGDGAY